MRNPEEIIFMIDDISKLSDIKQTHEIRRVGTDGLKVYNEHLKLCCPKHKRIFFKGVSQESWENWNNEGIEFYLLFVDGKPVARCSIEPYSEDKWEAADVKTVPQYRNAGLSKEIVAFVTRKILERGKIATCSTLPRNTAMLKVIDAVGYKNDVKSAVSVQFRDMTANEFNMFAQWSVKFHADALISAGEKNKNRAFVQAKTEFEEVFSDGINTKESYFYVIHNEKSENVGIVTYQTSPYDSSAAFITEFVIKDSFRGKGYGKGTLVRLFEEVENKGYSKIVLNVFKHNETAYGLYARCGFKVVEDYKDSCILEKIL
ncbi:MAG: GNAT family N-acetyltransferase [Clostridia bacterium]|nr:GNAT family N-acetyltransferase [Clostridia bacterium]